MKVAKVIAIIVAIAILILALTLGWSVLNFKYIAPWQHERNTEKAEISNQITWETGFADIYTIEATVEVSNESRSVFIEVVCAPKTVTESISLKNAVSSRKLVLIFSPRYHYIALSDGYRAIVPVPRSLSCDGLASDAKEKGLPFNLADYQRPSLPTSAEASVSCFGPPNGRFSQYYFIWGSPIAVLSRSTKRVRDVLTREEYGPADRAIVRKRVRERNELSYIRTDYPSIDRSFHWSIESNCWREILDFGKGECSSIAQSICVQNL